MALPQTLPPKRQVQPVRQTMIQPLAPPMKDTLVDEEVARITSKGSPVLEQARLEAGGAASRRGLRNSTIGTGMGDVAVIKTALPMAQQNAAQAQQRGMASDAFGYNTRLNQQSIDAQTAAAAADVEARRGINEQQFGFNTQLQESDFAGRTAMQETEAEQRSRLQREAGDIASTQTEQQFGFNQALQADQNAARIELQAQSDLAAADRLGLQLDQNTAIAIMDANTRLQINTDSLSAQERFQTGSFMLQADDQYNRTIAAISQNPDLPAAERARLQQNAYNVRDAAQKLLEGLYSSQFTAWPTEPQTQPAVTPPPPVVAEQPLLGDGTTIPNQGYPTGGYGFSGGRSR